MPDNVGVVAVAYSGGRDSTALLHATACAVSGVPGLRVAALHVHHGLSTHADAWLSHAQQTCQTWQGQGLPVSLVYRKVQVHCTDAHGIEGEARRLRYAALHDMAMEVGADLLLLAHHRQDQAETLLLQALRGGGLAGLAAMPRASLRNGVAWVRPWLNQSRETINAYVSHHNLAYIEDDSNADERFARNRLRAKVWPALVSAFPQAEAALAASTRRLSDAIEPLALWADAAVKDMTVPGTQGRSLDAVLWRARSLSQRRETLRHWFHGLTGESLSASWTERLTQELPTLIQRQSSARWLALALSYYRGVLTWHDDTLTTTQTNGAQAAHVETLRILAPGDWTVPTWHGMLRVTETDVGGGVAPEVMDLVQLRPRTGGEHFQLAPGRPARLLKKQYQARGVPAWLRHGPIFYRNTQLVYVPGLGIDTCFQSPAGVLQWQLEWLAVTDQRES